LRKWTWIGGVAGILLAVSGCGGGGSSPPSTPTAASIQTVPNTVEIGRNVVRVPGVSPADVSAAATLTAFDPKRVTMRPEGWVLVPDDDWQDAVLAAQFAAAPISAGLLAIDREYIPPGPGDVLARIKPKGFPKAEGLEVMVLDKAGTDVYVDLQDLSLKPTALTGDPVELAAKLVPFRGGWAGTYSDVVLIVSAEDRDYALPAAAWSAYSGDTVAFVNRDGVPAATRELLVQRQKLRLRKPTIYVIGPESVIPDDVSDTLRRYGTVKRIAGRDAIGTSVALARYHDPSTGFGWGIKRGPASVSLVSTSEWPNAIGALTFAAAGPQAPVLLTDSASELPSAVRSYLEDLRGSKPSQAYVFGGTRALSSDLVAGLDELLDARS
jgi:hypothetical protein